MPTKFKRINLLVPAAIKDRLKEEANYLRLKSRVTMIDGAELASTADLIRWCTNLYIDYCLYGEPEAYTYDGDTEPVAFTLDSQTRGRWEYALKYRYADNYHALASISLTRYFDQVDRHADRDRRFLEHIATVPVIDLIGQIRQGLIYDL